MSTAIENLDALDEVLADANDECRNSPEVVLRSSKRHCWHVDLHSVPGLPGLFGSEQICCWCGDKRALTAGPYLPITHGKFKPAEERP